MDTAVKVLIAVIIEALLLFGLYGLFNDVIISTTTSKVTSMFKLEGSFGGGVPGGRGTPNKPAFAVREEGDYKYTCNSSRLDVVVKNTSKTSYGEIQLEIAGICSCFQISKKFVNMLSIEDEIHSYYIIAKTTRFTSGCRRAVGFTVRPPFTKPLKR